MVYILALFLILTVAALAFGLRVFVKDGELNKKYGNKMMRFRIFFQFLALVCAMLIVYLYGK